ncbi:MAG: chemoreceptor glutamine deamidase CheD [Pseudomonadales bacterium]|nr:chemoreceptor glutamine deamidase CheD [Pseudomonadales bacterium]
MSDFQTRPRPLPPLLSHEFRSVQRYWDPVNHLYAAKIAPGEYYATQSGEMIVTVLGSCVAACIRDTHTGLGGMNHFMLPFDPDFNGDWRKDCLSRASRYGNVAMEKLINIILANGGRRQRLECKIFGGAAVLNLESDIGQQNINFIRDYLRIENIQIAASDLGGKQPRKLRYYPVTGLVRLKKLQSVANTTLQMRELSYQQQLQQRPLSNEVTLFNE